MMTQAASAEFPNFGVLWSSLWVMVEIIIEWVKNMKNQTQFFEDKIQRTYMNFVC